MIIIDNKRFYMTFGESCYALERTDSGVKSLCFGARVEPEDDMRALFVALLPDGESEGSAELCTPVRGSEFVLVDAQKLAEKPSCDLPALRGEKTLVLKFADEKRGLEQTLFYTPYSRGGLARRTEIRNAGDKPVKINTLGMEFSLPAGLELSTKCDNCFILDESGGGSTYGFCMMYGGAAELDVQQNERFTRVRLNVDFDEPLLLEPGQTVSSPEVFAAFSDNGTDGVSRIIHDVLREYAMPQAFGEMRPPVVVECPGDGTTDVIETRIQRAAQLGADTVLIAHGQKSVTKNGEKQTDKDDRRARLECIVDACRNAGIRLGLKIEYGAGLTAHDAAALVNKYSVGYLAVETHAPQGSTQSFEYFRGLYAFYAELTAACPELIIEGTDVGSLVYAAAVYCPIAEALKYSVYYPPRALSCRVSYSATALKTAFDIASLYCLGYELDPIALSEGAARAIRAQVYSYQDDAQLVANGDFYRGKNFVMAVSKDKSKAYAVYRQGRLPVAIKFCGLDEHNLYHVRELDKTFSGVALRRYGIPSAGLAHGETASFHITQVVDYE